MDTAERARIAAEAEYELLRGKAFEKRNLHSAFWVSGAAHMVSKHLKLHEKSMEYMQHKATCIANIRRSGGLPLANLPTCTCGLSAHLSTLRAEVEPPTTTK